MKLRALIEVVAVWLLVFAFGFSAHAGDWPMWRYDAGRGASSPDALPAEMHLQWVRQLPPARPAWPKTQKKLQFDIAPQPVAMGKRLFVPSTVSDSVTAYSTETGEQLWRFYADGPVRFAPIAFKEKVFFVSDDGHLYCLSAAVGKLLWKISGGPTDRRIIGNHRLISSWPARGGPVLHEGKIFFAASIWPFMGIFVHSVDAATGQTVWTNSGDGMNFTVQPHGAPSFATIVPQGHLAASGENLIVPGGRSTPAVFDTKTGKMKYFRYDKKYGSHHVSASADEYYVAGIGYHLATGSRSGGSRPTVMDDKFMIYVSGSSITVTSAGGGIKKTSTVRDRRGKKKTVTQTVRIQLFKGKISGGADRVFLKAGQRLYGTKGDGTIVALDLSALDLEKRLTDPAARKKTAEISVAEVTGKIEGTAWTMLAANHRLFVVTTAGRIYCFGAAKGPVKTHRLEKAELPVTADGSVAADGSKAQAKNILDVSSMREGYAVVLGLGKGRLIEQLIEQSRLHVVVVDPDAKKIDAFRRRMDAVGLYGTRVAAHVGNPVDFAFPPYLANLIVSEDLGAAGFEKTDAFVKKVFQTLRPYGGVACLEISDAQQNQLARSVKKAQLAGAEIKKVGLLTLLVRQGALPETDDWTHQYANAAQTVVSNDRRVQAPLGLLWFGGPSHAAILPRHGHGPSPQVAGGRLFIEGPDMLRAMDVYTGRVLWEKQLPGLGKYYNKTGHFPGAGEIGSNYVSLPDQVYVVFGSVILELDAATGKTIKQFVLEKGKENPSWGYLAVSGDLLIATSRPVDVRAKGGSAESLPTTRYASGSRLLVVFDRRTGKQLWQRKAQFNFRHNNIAIGDGKIFCIDNFSSAKYKSFSRRAIKFKGTPTLYALDEKTGNVLWSTKQRVFGTFVNYSAQHDVLLQAGSAYRDRASDENKTGMIAYRGKDGKVLWDNPSIRYGGPCLLWRDKIITNGGGGFALDIQTGKPTGWKYSRQYGCNTAIGSWNLLTFRSGAAGFCDLANDSGTGNFGGFKSSCTANLIPANGVLNAPDYTRTCSCAYQNQTSLALVHMPEAEFWTFGGAIRKGQIGLNFGAPGDRRADNGTLWLDTPNVGGPSQKISVAIEPKDAQVFRFHSSGVTEGKLKWVAASGLKAARRVTVEVEKGKTYTVNLHFLEPENIKIGERVFNVLLQNKSVLTNFDILEQAQGHHRAIVRKFTAASADGRIVIELAPKTKRPTLLSGVELIRQ